MTEPTKVEIVKKTKWYTWLFLILILAIALPVCIGMLTGEDEPSPTFSPANQPGQESVEQPPQEEKLLQKFEAKSDHTTRPFTVPDKWEVRWNFTGTSHHSIVTYHANGTYGDLLLNESDKPTQGSKFIPKGGDYYLEISGSEAWTVEVWQVP